MWAPQPSVYLTRACCTMSCQPTGGGSGGLPAVDADSWQIPPEALVAAPDAKHVASQVRLAVVVCQTLAPETLEVCSLRLSSHPAANNGSVAVSWGFPADDRW